MSQHRLRASAPFLLGCFGAVLFLVAIAHHVNEVSLIDGVTGPVLAVALDGLLALGIVYSGYWVAGTDLPTEGEWTALSWSLGGAVLIGGVISATVLVRAFEGRTIAEPIFPVLVATEVGAIAGLLAGYNNARARADARRAKTISDAFAFVNTLIRHDLRNDLTVIRGYAEAIAADLGPTANENGPGGPSVVVEKSTEALDRIDTTEAIAETLLGEASLEPVDIAGITAEMANRVEEAFEATVTTDLPDEALVTGNAGLRSVVDNLLENAAEHNDADDPSVHVDVTTDSETVRLVVRDNGPGIPDSRKGTIFDSEPGDPSGSGLSLVGTLIDAYGGSVRIEDNEPRGSVFVVELPRAAATDGCGRLAGAVGSDASPWPIRPVSRVFNRPPVTVAAPIGTGSGNTCSGTTATDTGRCSR
ncbi:histidine kinase [Natrinema pellirubrum DSM 15624]|uniref:histidine kinase n=1 Tax=Natrinema pellirubrum (strain DSM 15624 / CIP 106293 / JCM 10476 / NCIMB 786 / 157) TaxID=797303 RepID=L0JRI5_NATP1|nr:ATP-binding protein [Natrinema pellirubrum]AGB33237.1 signal transduction histidine kinase [Natrinema pellirubrum DSM 15624]ELY71603.1 histidine kinase [Natrinema pellirubrum DSM 15624]